MKYIVTFSGGKDSLATIIWAKENLPDFDVVFCDTGWESPKTYAHIKEIETWIGKQFITLKSKKFEDIIDLFIQKKRAASTKARFCTEEMKSKPMIDYILGLGTDVTVLQGVRNEESESRRNLKMNDEYFKFYVEPYGFDKKGKPKFHTYRKKDVLASYDTTITDVLRPIIKWSAGEVFEYIFKSGIKANPLYYEGFSRVGCFPCIMCTHSEIRLIAETYKERIDEIRALETKIGRTFFPPNYIPAKYCTVRTVSKKGKMVMCPSIDDVIKYVMDDPNQSRLFEKKTTGCISVYSICESES